ncbi:unnamed protein product [Lymnaea stagnalis]|uniref:G-protein coupled receptors family 1 profile domain-containing protein n=1 Tax=Lymnaea stagnalis TaxID=6523 RepID=A0AAV2GZY0_LYMST
MSDLNQTVITMDDLNLSCQVNSTLAEIEICKVRRSDQMAVTLLPAILVLCVIMVVGTVGNCLVFYVYYFKFTPSSARSAILALACYDLLTCALSIPGEILDMRYSYNFDSEEMCRGIRLVTTVILVASGLLLVMVAVDRYQRICHPLGDHLTASDIWKRTFILFVLAMIIAVPTPIIYGLADIPISEGIHGTECSTNQDYKNHPLRKAYIIILGLVFLVAFAIMIVIYILIGRQVLRQKAFRNNVQQRRGSIVSAGANCRHTLYSGSNEDNEPQSLDGMKDSSLLHDKEQDLKDINSLSAQNNSVAAKKVLRKPSVLRHLRKISSNRDNRLRKTTMMLFFITLVFVISFLPHIILKGVQALNKNFVQNLSTVGVIFYNIFVRSCFFNTAVNFFVYGTCSPKFRNECRALISKLAFWIKRRRASVEVDDIQ